MAVSKRRIAQQSKHSEEVEVEGEDKEEIRFNRDKKILKARRKHERPDRPKVSLLGNGKTLYSQDQQLKGLNQSFIEGVDKAYSIDNTYNFNSLFSQYNTYRDGIVGHTPQRPGLVSQPLSVPEILRIGLPEKEPQSDQQKEQQQKANFILGQHISLPNEKSQNLFGEKIETNSEVKNMTGTSSTNNETKEKPVTDQNHVINETAKKGKKKPESTDEKKKSDKPLEEVKTENLADEKVNDNETPKKRKQRSEPINNKIEKEDPKEETEESTLFNMKCKVFVRKTNTFEDLGFHKVSVHLRNKERVISIFDENAQNEILSIPLDKSSVRPYRSKKEMAFVDPDTTLLYKVKLATAEDADQLIFACTKTKP